MINKLSTIVKQSGLTPVQAKPMLDNFGDFFVQAHKLSALAKGITVTSIDQIEEMEKARELRLQLRDVRVEANKARIALKEGYLRGGNAVQEIFNNIKAITKPEEDRLLEQEKFAERIRVEGELAVERNRIYKLSKFVDDVDVYKLHPSQLSTESFETLLATSSIAFRVKKASEHAKEKEEILRVKAEKREQERIKKENEKLKVEAEKREKVVAKRQAKAASKLRAERRARKKIEAKLKAKEDAIKKEKEAAEVAQRIALLAPDKIKLTKVLNNIVMIEWPALKSKQAQDVCELIMEKLQNIVEEFRDEIKKL